MDWPATASYCNVQLFLGHPSNSSVQKSTYGKTRIKTVCAYVRLPVVRQIPDPDMQVQMFQSEKAVNKMEFSTSYLAYAST